MKRRLRFIIYLLVMSFPGRLSAQQEVMKQMEVSISSHMQMKLEGKSSVSFEIPENSKETSIKNEQGLKIQVQSNRNWVLQVKSLEANLSDPTHNDNIPAESLKIRANGESFSNLNNEGINLINGNKGTYQAQGNSLSIDYELTYKKEQRPSNYKINLLFTLAAR
jgi:hypothetical protein